MRKGQSITVSISPDGREDSWTIVDTVGPDTFVNPDRETPIAFANKNGRYVRLSVTTNGMVTSIREVRLWGWPQASK